MNNSISQQNFVNNSRIAQLEAIVSDISKKMNEYKSTNSRLLVENSHLESTISDMRDDYEAIKIAMDTVKEASQTIVTQIDERNEDNIEIKALQLRYELLDQVCKNLEKENRDLKSYWLDLLYHNN